jgi:signal transduction histidine kinase
MDGGRGSRVREERAGHIGARDSNTYLAGTMKAILRGAIRALQAAAGAILLINDPVDAAHALPSDQLYVTIGLRDQARRALRSALLEAATALNGERQNGTLLRLSELADREPRLPDAPLLDRFVIMPIGVVGLIAVLRSAIAFTVIERHVLDAFAGQVAIALENALLADDAKRQRARAEWVIAQSADGLLGLDAHLAITTYNKSMERLTGRPAWEALGRPFRDVVALYERGDDGTLLVHESLEAILATTRESKAGANGERAALDAVLVGLDGQRIDVAIALSVRRDGDGKLESAVLNIRDVTANRQLEDLRTAFLSMTTHELQTPVAIIQAYAETLRRKYSSANDTVLKDALGAIEDECHRLSRLVGNLLRVSRIEAGGLELRKVPVDFGDLCGRVIRRISPRAGPAFHIRAEVAENVPSVMADEERIEEVLTNLVENAVKYSPQGGEIVIAVQYPGSRGFDEVEVQVRDHGPGIPIRELGRLFDRFYRTNSASTSRTTGAGLGLYLSRAIVRAHGGEFFVESRWGEGSTFSFTLPRSGPHRRPALPLAQTLALDAPTEERYGAI